MVWCMHHMYAGYACLVEVVHVNQHNNLQLLIIILGVVDRICTFIKLYEVL